MLQPLQITFRGMESSAAVEARIYELVERLERLFQRMTRCHVVVHAPHRQHHQGQLYDVRIQIRVPGNEIVVNGDGSQDHAHEDVYVALRDAFAAAEHKLGHEEPRRGHRSRRIANRQSV
jgi:ribosome-associated translation inhibitor RaiA